MARSDGVCGVVFFEEPNRVEISHFSLTKIGGDIGLYSLDPRLELVSARDEELDRNASTLLGIRRFASSVVSDKNRLLFCNEIILARSSAGSDNFVSLHNKNE